MEIMCTLTGQQIRCQGELISNMAAAGMRAVRINTAHLADTHELDQLLTTLKETHPDIRVLIDTKGPELRTTSVDKDIILPTDNYVTILGCNSGTLSTASSIKVNFGDFHRHVAPGDEVLIDDARLRLKVTSVDNTGATAKVMQGGILGSRKGVTVKGRDFPLPAVCERDRAFISYAATSPMVDVIAHSFVRSAADVEAVKECLGGAPKPIIAKIENQQGLDNAAEIAASADGLLIARGDLTASLGAENVPAAQQKISECARASGKLLYLATNILSSMLDSPTPSAANIEGINAALRQGVTTFLLTNETAAGAYPLECVEELAHYLLFSADTTLLDSRLITGEMSDS